MPARHLAEIAHYSVKPDVDQPGLFLWRHVCGDGSPTSFATEAQAWDDADREVVSATMGANDLSSADWDRMTLADQEMLVAAAFEVSPIVGYRFANLQGGVAQPGMLPAGLDAAAVLVDPAAIQKAETWAAAHPSLQLVPVRETEVGAQTRFLSSLPPSPGPACPRP